ncbi:MAG: hypothetical protein ABIF82_15185 [Planctomycetota bacterium]
MREWIGAAAKYLLYAAFAVSVFHQALASQRETRRMFRERRRIRAEIAQLRRENVRREHMRRALASDPFYVERTLRERYGYRSPGELPPASAGAGRVSARRPASFAR